MDFQRFQRNISTKKEPKKAQRNKKKCDNTSYSCNIFPNDTNTDMMSPIVYELFYFNQKVLNLTQELWSDLLSIVGQVEILSRKKGCFSINNADECMALNEFYLKFNSDLVSYQNLYLDSENVGDDYNQLKNVLNALEIFLNKTLPMIEKDIKNITVMISTCRKGGCSVKTFVKYNVGNIVNDAIINYLSKFRQTVACFGQEEIPPEMIIQKEKIISAIEKIFIKKGGLLENVDFKCEDRAYLVDNFYDDKAFKETTRPFKHDDVPSDNLAYEDTIDLFSAVNITKENVTTSNFNIDAEKNSNVTSNNTLRSFFKEPSNINGYIVHDVHKNSDAYRYDATSSFEHEQLDEVEYASNEKLIIFVSIASVFGLIAFLVFFGIKKYKRRKKDKQIKGQALCFNEQARFKDYFLNNY